MGKGQSAVLDARPGSRPLQGNQVSASAATGACEIARLHTGCMREPEAPKAGWISRFPASPPEKDGLVRIVDADGGRDDAENSYYEEAADQASSAWRKRGARVRG
jgi:hypothetical protein